MHRHSLISLLLPALLVAARPVVAQEASGLEARVWLDRGGEEPVVRRGESVRVYYRTQQDAFAAIFRIDTDGRVHLLYPQHPGAIDVVEGGRDYRLLFSDGAGWRVEEDPGMGYFFIVASPEPLDFSLFPYDEQHGWDVAAVGAAVYSDPYVAIDDYVATIVPNWETVPYALDFLTYSVGETYSYPRFLCYDCHTYQRYASWNPYDYNCVTYRVVIYDDPFFYPRYRYSGVNVVYAWPVRSLPRYEVTRRVVGDAVAPIVRVRTPAAREAAYAAYKESPVATSPRTATAERRSVANGTATAAPAARSGLGVAPVRRSAAGLAAPQERSRTGVAPQQVPDTARARPTLQRRPSARLPVRTPPSARPTQPPTASPRPAEPKAVTPAPSRTSPRAPIARPETEPRAPQAAPSTRPSTGTRTPTASPTPSTSRPSAGSEPRTSPGASTRSAPRPTQQQPSARTQPAPRPSPSSGGGSVRPSPSRPSTGSAPSRAPSNPPARATAPPRSAEPRPTVRPRPAEPSDPN